MRGWSIFFLAAGAFNLLGGAVGFFTIEAQLRRQGLPPPTYPFAFQTLFLAVAILGVAYLIVARNPPVHHDLVWIGLLTKTAGMAMSYWAIYDGQMPVASWWQPLFTDFVWIVGFAVFLATVRSGSRG
jgi:hypothetical protein